MMKARRIIEKANMPPDPKVPESPEAPEASEAPEAAVAPKAEAAENAPLAEPSDDLPAAPEPTEDSLGENPPEDNIDDKASTGAVTGKYNSSPVGDIKMTKAKGSYNTYKLELSMGQLEVIRTALESKHDDPVSDELLATLSYYMDKLPGPGEDEESTDKTGESEQPETNDQDYADEFEPVPDSIKKASAPKQTPEAPKETEPKEIEPKTDSMPLAEPPEE
jgi:hypothetical protein